MPLDNLPFNMYLLHSRAISCEIVIAPIATPACLFMGADSLPEERK